MLHVKYLKKKFFFVGNMNSKKGKTDCYNLYSCSHLPNSKINLKVDKSSGRSTKVIKYCSNNNNPLLTINSPNGQTTVFLPPSRSVLKTSNELDDNRFPALQYDFVQREESSSKIPFYSNFNDFEEHQMFPNEASAKRKLNNTFADSNGRYLPNILKTKSSKVKIDFQEVKSDNENKSTKETSHRKRKQTYNLSNNDNLDIDSKEKFSLPEKKRSKIETNPELKAAKKIKPKKEMKNEKELKCKKKIEKKEIVEENEGEIEMEIEGIKKKRKISKRNEMEMEIGVNGKRKQSDVSSVEEDEPLKKRMKIGRKCKKMSDTTKDKKKNDTCARVCPFSSKKIHTNVKKSFETSEINLSEEEAFINLFSEDEKSASGDETPIEDIIEKIKNESSSECEICISTCENSLDTINENKEEANEETNLKTFQEIENNEFHIVEELPREIQITEKYSETSVEALLGFDFEEFQSEMKSFEKFYFEKKQIPFPIDGEFLIPDYLSYVSTNDTVEFSDDVHKLISTSLFSEIMEIIPPINVKHAFDLNDNLKLPNLNFLDLDETFGLNCFNSPMKASHHKLKDALINGNNSEDFDYDNNQCCNFSNSDSSNEHEDQSNESFEECSSSKEIIVDDKLLNSEFAESSEEDNTDENDNYPVPDSPKSCKTDDEINSDLVINIDR